MVGNSSSYSIFLFLALNQNVMQIVFKKDNILSQKSSDLQKHSNVFHEQQEYIKSNEFHTNICCLQVRNEKLRS